MENQSSSNTSSRKEFLKNQSRSRSASNSPQTSVKTYSTRIERRDAFQDSAEVALLYKNPTSSGIYKSTSQNSRNSKVETSGKHETVVGSGQWKQVMTTTVNSENDLLLELSTFGNPQQSHPQNVPMIELVVAVQSAIKQRQNIIDEWKKRAEDLTFQLQDLANEKNVFEKMCREKESKVEFLQKRLQELTGQYGDLSIQTDDIHEDLAAYRVECERLKSVYQCAMHELNESRCKLMHFEEQKNRLEGKLRLKEQHSEKMDQQLRIIEPELNAARETIRLMQDRINATESELSCLRQASQMEIGGSSEKQVSITTYHGVLDRLKCSLLAFEEEKKKGMSIQDELQRLACLIESLSNEKGDLCALLSSLQADKQELQDKNSQLESQLLHAQNQISHFKFIGSEMEGDIKCLGEKVDRLLIVNKNLEFELNDSNRSLKQLKKSLLDSEQERDNISNVLNCVRDELDQQKLAITGNEVTIRNLRNEKSIIDNKLKSQEELERKRLQELNRMCAENENFRNENNELQAKCDLISKSLFVSEEEVKRLRTEVQELIAAMEHSKRQFQARIEALQKHNFCKEEDWRDYMAKEMSRLNDEHQKELDKFYSEMLANRSVHRESLDATLQLELSSANKCLETEISMLKRELEDTGRQLQVAIVAAEEERKDILAKASNEQARLMEQLYITKQNAAKMSAEIEGQLQRLTQKSIEDGALISKLTSDSKRLQSLLDKSQKIDDEWEQTKSELIAEREALKADLGHCRNLLCITENTCDRLKFEIVDLKKCIVEYSETKDSLHREVLNLQNLLGQKESQLEINLSTLNQTRNLLNRTKEENNELQCHLDAQKVQMESVEENVRSLTLQIKSLNLALYEANKEKKDAAMKKEILHNEIHQLKSKLAGMAQDSVVMNEKCQYTEKCLIDMQAAHTELKKKLHDTESALVQAQSECKEITNRYVQELDASQVTGQQLARLQSEHCQLEQASRVKMTLLEKEMLVIRDEVDQCRNVISLTEKRLGYLKNCLCITESVYIQSAKTLSELWDSVTNCLLQDSIQISESPLRNQSPFNLRTRSQAFSSPCPSPINDISGQIVSGSIASTPIRPLCIDHEQCDEYCQRDSDMKDLIVAEQKLTKLRVLIKNFIDRKSHLERSDLLKDKEISQLRECMYSLKEDYEEQMRKLNERLSERTKSLELAECQMIETKMMLTSKEECLKGVTIASKNALKQIEKLESIISCLQREKLQFQKDLEFMTIKLSELESQNLSFTSQLRESECKLSKIQIRNVSLEGEIESLKLLLQSEVSQNSETSDSLMRQTSQKQELLEKLAQLQLELDVTAQELNEMKLQQTQNKFSFQSDEQCETKGNCCLKNRCHHLHTCVADFELERQLLSERLEASQLAEHNARLMIVGLEETIKSLKYQMEINEIEHAALQGRVTQLQQAFFTQDSSSSSQTLNQITTQSTEYQSQFLKDNIKKLQISITTFEDEKATLERVVSQLKCENENLNRNLSQAKEQKLMVERELESFKHKATELQRLVALREQELGHMRRTVEGLRGQIKSGNFQMQQSDTYSGSPSQFSNKDSTSEASCYRQYTTSQSSVGATSGSRVTAGVISCSSRISCHKEGLSGLSDGNKATKPKPGDPVFEEYHKSTYITSVVPPHFEKVESRKTQILKDSGSGFSKIPQDAQTCSSPSPVSRCGMASGTQSIHMNESHKIQKSSSRQEASSERNSPVVSMQMMEERKSSKSRSRSNSPSLGSSHRSQQDSMEIEYCKKSTIDVSSHPSRSGSTSSLTSPATCGFSRENTNRSSKGSTRSMENYSRTYQSDKDALKLSTERIQTSDVETHYQSGGEQPLSAGSDYRNRYYAQESPKNTSAPWTDFTSSDRSRNSSPTRSSYETTVTSPAVIPEETLVRTLSISSSESMSHKSPQTRHSSLSAASSSRVHSECESDSHRIMTDDTQALNYTVVTRTGTSYCEKSPKSRESGSDDVPPKRTSSSSVSTDSLGRSSTLV